MASIKASNKISVLWLILAAHLLKLNTYNCDDLIPFDKWNLKEQTQLIRSVSPTRKQGRGYRHIIFPAFCVLKKVSEAHWQSLTTTDDPRKDFVTLFLFLLSLEEWKQNSVMPCTAPWGLHRLFADGKCIVPCAAAPGSASAVPWKQVNHFLTLIPSFILFFFPLIMRFICSNVLLPLYCRVGTPNLLQQW